MADRRELDPSFFLLTNKDPYYVWFLPRGRRVSLLVEEEALLIRDESEKRLPFPNAPIDILGVTVTGYIIPKEYTTSQIDLFVLDTFYDMRDPYTQKEMIEEMTRVSTLAQFVISFNRHSLDLKMVAQTLYGITLQEWGSRIDYIWSTRVKLSYPVVGLVFYNRERLAIHVWRSYNSIQSSSGARLVLSDMGFDHVDDTILPEELTETQLTWDDLSGHGVTIPLWYVRERWQFGSRLNFAEDVQTLTPDEKNELTSSILMSPRQVNLLQ